ncbi:hypothetical protein IFM89_001279 [Coptis chinensis]|uniref:Uncharacterized protein n=1 Tax=Coptis chinensis TaxID=261450 RepID=A0A835LGM2_9MAGN|nr:hypothetical protein IFM89_001279 [Coptis chinensis]
MHLGKIVTLCNLYLLFVSTGKELKKLLRGIPWRERQHNTFKGSVVRGGGGERSSWILKLSIKFCPCTDVLVALIPFQDRETLLYATKAASMATDIAELLGKSIMNSNWKPETGRQQIKRRARDMRGKQVKKLLRVDSSPIADMVKAEDEILEEIEPNVQTGAWVQFLPILTFGFEHQSFCSLRIF